MLRSSLLAVLALGSFIGCGSGLNGEDEEGITPCEVPARSCQSANQVPGAEDEEYDEDVRTAGVSYCFIDDDGNEEWTDCCGYNEDDASEGVSEACQGCVAPWEEPPSGGDCDTPLVLSFDSRAVEFTSTPGATFNLTRQSSTSVQSDWPTSATPWLALDLNDNGAVDDGGELFGSATRLGDGFARNGFLALRALDENADGVLDAADPAFAKLLIWRDADNSRTSESAELSPASLEVLSIELAYTIARRCDERKNCEVERATFKTLDARGDVVNGAVIDVHIRHE